MGDCDGDSSNGCEARLDQPPNCGTCNGGTVSCYPDGDSDGYGARGSTAQTRCGPGCPAGQAPVAGDCDDSSHDIHPGRTMPLFVFPADATTFDANCDGRVDLSTCAVDDHSYCPALDPGAANCSAFGPNACNDGAGWQSGPPTCGQTAASVSCVHVNNSCAAAGTQQWIGGCL